MQQALSRFRQGGMRGGGLLLAASGRRGDASSVASLGPLAGGRGATARLASSGGGAAAAGGSGKKAWDGGRKAGFVVFVGLSGFTLYLGSWQVRSGGPRFGEGVG